MKTLIKIISITLLTLSVNIQAESKFLIAAASSSGTYQEMVNQIASVCGDDQHSIALVDTKGGAAENLEQLVNNKANAAFLHSDIIYAKAMIDSSYRKYKTLVNLYPEEIHILALRTAKEKTGGIAGIGAKPVVYNYLSDLTGLKVGASGGSAITAKILSGSGGGNFDVVTYSSGKEVIKALDEGEIQAALFVGGAPLPNLLLLNANDYKLLSIGESIVSKVTGDSGIYKPAVISYTNLKAESIKTISTSAIILTRLYTVDKFVQPQKWFRDCFYSKLTELQETPDTHKKWQEIDKSDHGVWEYYVFPGE